MSRAPWRLNITDVLTSRATQGTRVLHGNVLGIASENQERGRWEAEGGVAGNGTGHPGQSLAGPWEKEGSTHTQSSLCQP